MSKPRRTILITGATSGIGRHAALHLAARGHRVFASGRNQSLLESLRRDGGGRIEVLPLDVTDAGSLTRAHEAINRATNGEGIDALVNNAGFGILGPTELISDGDLRAQFETNVFGLMNVVRTFLPQMRARGAGRIINVSSLGGRYTLPLYGAYNSTKYAVESLSDALRVELRPFGVSVVLVEPGAIRSEFFDRSMDGGAKYRDAASPYAPVTDRSDDVRRMAELTAVGPLCISRAIERAATARRPKARYAAPFFAAAFVDLMRALPTRMADGLAAVMVGFTRRRFARHLAAAPPRLQLDSSK
jgi:short-subunit dehydrogenase